MLKTYQKIETLCKFNEKSRKFVHELKSDYVKYLMNVEWYATTKYDGTNVRVYWDGYNISFHGRTDKSQLPNEVKNLLEYAFKGTEPIFEQHFGNKEVILFMECYGGKIQGSKKNHWYNNTDETLIGFDVMINEHYLNRISIKEIFDLFNIESVELKKYNTLMEIIKETYSLAYNQQEYFEGYVCTPVLPLYDNNNNRIIVKIKCEQLKDTEMEGKK